MLKFKQNIVLLFTSALLEGFQNLVNPPSHEFFSFCWRLLSTPFFTDDLFSPEPRPYQ